MTEYKMLSKNIRKKRKQAKDGWLNEKYAKVEPQTQQSCIDKNKRNKTEKVLFIRIDKG